jgi:glyoxylate reductase
MTKPKVYVSTQLPADATERIKSTCDAEFWTGESSIPHDVLLAKVESVDGLLSSLTEKIDHSIMEAAPRLKVVSNFAVGFDNIDVGEATKRGIAVGNTPGVLTETTADFAFALLMAAARRVGESDRYVRAGKWRVSWESLRLLGEDIHGATLGIVGLGRIGTAFARRASGFGMAILYTDVLRQMQSEQEVRARFVDLRTLLSESDFVSLHTNLTAESRHLIDERTLKMMKKNGILVNTARGSIVDSMALYEALRRGQIRAAALDVTDPEPLPPDHPLLGLENVIITPHVASGSVRTRSKMANLAVDNLLAGLSGKTLPYPVNPEVRPTSQS